MSLIIALFILGFWYFNDKVDAVNSDFRRFKADVESSNTGIMFDEFDDSEDDDVLDYEDDSEDEITW